MIEQAIYFGLGCAVAGLVSLAFLPVLWARALRLTRQRLQRHIPVSMQEIMADRDHLRAEFAVEQRKLEQAMDRLRDGKAHDMSEIGRRSSEIVALSDVVAALQRTKTELSAQVSDLQREAREHAGQLGAVQIGLHDAHERIARREADLKALRAAHEALEGLSEERRTTVAGLHTRTMGLEMTIEDGVRARAALEKQLDAMRQAPASEPGASGPADALEAAAAQIHTLETALREAKEREKSIHLQKSMQVERVRGGRRAGADKVEALQVENAALRGALEAARQRPDGLSGASAAMSPADAALRASIHEVGLAVARMTASGAINDLGNLGDSDDTGSSLPKRLDQVGAVASPLT